MNRFICYTAFVLILLSTHLSFASDINKPMAFSSGHNGGNCVGCVWMVAEGEIQKDTPQKFKEYLEEYGRPGPEVVLNSNGGNLFAAMELGRLFRKQGLATRIGKNVKTDEGMMPYDETVAGTCNSACAYAFMGGTERSIEASPFFDSDQGKIGFHQIHNNSFSVTGLSPDQQKLIDNTAFSAAQILSGLLIDYMMEMGINPLIMKKANEAKASEMYFPDAAELETFNVTTNSGYKDFKMVPYHNGLVTFTYEDNFQSLPVQAVFYCKLPEREKVIMVVSDRWTYNREDQTFVFSELIDFINEPVGKYDRNSIYSSYAEIRIDGQTYSWPQEKGFTYISEDFKFWNVIIDEEISKVLRTAKNIDVSMNTSNAEGYHSLATELDEEDRKMIALAYKNCI